MIRARLGGLVVALVVITMAAGCVMRGKNTNVDSAAPGATTKDGVTHGGGEGRRFDSGGDEPSALAARLRAAQAELRAVQAGEGPTDAPVATSESGREPLTRCERIEAIALRICELRDHVCGLAQEHEDEPRYAQVCNEAEASCAEATTVAQDCESA